ncbi:MAG: hypothetical protein ACUVTZ_07175 [Armatimonadota bacterium]
MRLAVGVAVLLLVGLNAVVCGEAVDGGGRATVQAGGGAIPLEVHAAWCRYEPEAERVTARGAVRIKYREYTATADEMEANLKLRQARLVGGVRVVGDGRDIRADSVVLNLETREWRAEQGRLQVQPEGMVSPLYLGADVLESVHGQLQSERPVVTTCDRSVPHYHIEASKLIIVPDKRIVALDAALYIGRRRWFTWRRLTVPLRRAGEGGYSISPETGQSSTEGYYVKTAYVYSAGKTGTGTAKIDIMSKLGLGFGVEQAYRLTGGTGTVALYSLLGRTAGEREVTGSFRHQQKVGSFVASLQGDLRRNSSRYFPGISTVSQLVSLTRSSARSNTSLAYRVDENTGTWGDYRRSSASLDQGFAFGRARARLSLGLFDSASPSYVQRELNTAFAVSSSAPTVDTSLLYERRDQLEGPEGTAFASLDRLPELSLRTNRQRLKGTLSAVIPGSLGFIFGEYRELPSGARTSRLLLDLASDEKRWRLGGTELSGRFGFRQAVYGIGAAQYVLSSNIRWSSLQTARTGFQVYHSYLNPAGYSPFRFDQPSEYNMVGVGLYHRGTRLNATVSTGLDLRGGPFRWQDVLIRSRFQPSRSVLWMMSTAYDLNRGRWRDVVNELRLRMGSFSMDLGTRFVPLTGKFSSIRWHITTPFAPKMRLETLAGYNGYRGQFDYRLLRITRDHHDWETSIVFVDERGYRYERGVRLEFRLKAFPQVDQFAVGQSGQYLDTTVGEVF